MKSYLQKISYEYFRNHPYHFKTNFSIGYKAFKKLKDVYDTKKYLQLFYLDTFLPYINKPILWINAKNDPIVKSLDTFTKINKFHSPLQKSILTRFGGHVGYAKTHGKIWISHITDKYFQWWSRK